MDKVLEIARYILALYELWKNYEEKKEIAELLAKMPKPKTSPSRWAVLKYDPITNPWLWSGMHAFHASFDCINNKDLLSVTDHLPKAPVVRREGPISKKAESRGIKPSLNSSRAEGVWNDRNPIDFMFYSTWTVLSSLSCACPPISVQTVMRRWFLGVQSSDSFLNWLTMRHTECYRVSLSFQWGVNALLVMVLFVWKWKCSTE